MTESVIACVGAADGTGRTCVVVVAGAAGAVFTGAGGFVAGTAPPVGFGGGFLPVVGGGVSTVVAMSLYPFLVDATTTPVDNTS